MLPQNEFCDKNCSLWHTKSVLFLLRRNNNLPISCQEEDTGWIRKRQFSLRALYGLYKCLPIKYTLKHLVTIQFLVSLLLCHFSDVMDNNSIICLLSRGSIPIISFAARCSMHATLQLFWGTSYCGWQSQPYQSHRNSILQLMVMVTRRSWVLWTTSSCCWARCSFCEKSNLLIKI